MNGAEPFVFCYDISDAALPKRAALNNIFSCIYCVKDVQIRSFFWSVFSRIWTENGNIRSKSPCSV